MRLIDAEKLPIEPVVPNVFISRDYAFGWNDMLRNVLGAEPIEAEPVRHGRWIEHEWAEEENGLLISNFECSNCHGWERKESDFCPSCGADMRERKEE